MAPRLKDSEGLTLWPALKDVFESELPTGSIRQEIVDVRRFEAVHRRQHDHGALALEWRLSPVRDAEMAGNHVIVIKNHILPRSLEA